MSFPRAPLLLVASSSRTGPAEGQIALAQWLRGQGIDARVAADSVKPGDIGAHLEAATVPFLRELHLSRHVRPLEVLRDLRTLRARLLRGEHDLLHAAFAHDHHVALAAARGTPALVVRTAHRAIDCAPGPVGRLLYRRTAGVAVHAESYRQRLLRAGLSPERVAAIPGGVDSKRFTPGRSPRLRTEWGVPADAPLAGIVARMKPERGHDVLLEAFGRMKLRGAHLVLVGRGEDEPRLRARAPPGVVFGGYRAGPALVEAYRALDVAVWLREGNDGACRGVLEAMACGLPVIAGDEGAPPELVGDTGLVVDPRSPDSIARALDALLADLPRARALGTLARRRAEGFTPARTAEAMLAFWRRLSALS